MGNSKLSYAMLMFALATSPVMAGGSQVASAAPTLSWISGHWCGESQDRRVEEVWLAETGGQLIGMAQTVEGNAVTSFEFMRIVSDVEGTRFHVQPDGAPPTVFTMEAGGDGWIRFANAAHDFPNRIEYRRDGDRLDAYIAGPDGEGGELRIPYRYRACTAGGH